MAYLRSMGAWVPETVVTNAAIAQRVGKTPEWIEEVSGIRERRFAAAEVTVADLALHAARDCLQQVPSAIGMLIVASGSAERRFPGPAAEVAHKLGFPSVPAVDLPIASAGSLFGMALAARLANEFGNILVIGAEKMSTCVDPADPNTAILFGDGAGACLISSEPARLRIVDSVLHSDGAFANDLKLGLTEPLAMNGMAVILQASRKIPAVIQEVLAKSGRIAADVDCFVMHQANQNLILKVARTLGVEPARFYSNIARYGNTSSASMLIAGAECWKTPARSLCFAAFGAGFHWGALLAEDDGDPVLSRDRKGAVQPRL